VATAAEVSPVPMGQNKSGTTGASLAVVMTVGRLLLLIMPSLAAH